MVDFFKSKKISRYLLLNYDGIKIIDKPDNKNFSLKQLECDIFIKTGIKTKLAFQEIKDEFTEYETNVNTDNLPKNKNNK